MEKPMKRVAAIHDIVSFGKAALTNIIPVMSVLNIDVCPIPTLVLSTHMGGFGVPAKRHLDGYIDQCRKHYEENNIKFHSILVGYLGDRQNITETKSFIEDFKTDDNIVLIDPILGDQGRMYSGFTDDYRKELKDIIGHADIITPNVTEACLLTDRDYSEDLSDDDILDLCRKLSAYGCRNVVITSVKGKDQNSIGIAVYKEGNFKILYSDRIKQSLHGTGDVFDAVFLGKLLNGLEIEEAVTEASEFVRECIKYSLKYEYPRREGLMIEAVLDKLRK